MGFIRDEIPELFFAEGVSPFLHTDKTAVISYGVIQHIEAVKEDSAIYQETLFLAGGITGCADWQKELVTILEKELPVGRGLTIYNPRRPHFDVTDPSASDAQIDWEYLRLRTSTQILFWFAPETPCPIALFELGGALKRASLGKHKLFIGSHPDYERIFDVRYQTSRMFPKLSVVTSIRALADQVCAFNASLTSAPQTLAAA